MLTRPRAQDRARIVPIARVQAEEGVPLHIFRGASASAPSLRYLDSEGTVAFIPAPVNVPAHSGEDTAGYKVGPGPK